MRMSEPLIALPVIIVILLVIAIIVLVTKRSPTPDHNSLLLKLMEKNQEHRGQTELGVKSLLDNNQKQIHQIVAELRQQLRDSQRETVDLKSQNAAIGQHLQLAAEATKSLSDSTASLRN